MDELIYRIALTLLPLNNVTQSKLLQRAGSATNIYNHRKCINDILPDATPQLQSIVCTLDSKLQRASDELDYCTNMGIKVLTMSDADYPRRLLEIPDLPTVLYYKGKADLNAPHCVSIVGTRKSNEYGRDLCDMFIDELRRLVPDVVVFSGLAFGIDIAAHRRCLKCNIPTVGVVAHGHEMIYPIAHRNEAEEMVRNGGLLTEYHSYSSVNKNNFLSRNRIVAGCADATIVVQSPEKGGALHTARLAYEYNREVYTFPARVNDENNFGCLDLVYNNQATLIRSAAQFVERQGWQVTRSASLPVQTSFYATDDERALNIIKVLRHSNEPLRLEQIAARVSVSPTDAMTVLVELEMDGVVEICSNGRYRLEKAYS